MADIDTWLTVDKDRSRLEAGYTPYFRQFSLAAGNQNDVIRLIDIEPGFVATGFSVIISGTLGSSCTLQLRHGTTALTAASTAAAANALQQSVGDTESTSDRNLNIVIAGANVGATATVTVAGHFHRPAYQ